MSPAKWKAQLLGAHNPPSLTAAEPARVAETRAGLAYAVKNGWAPADKIVVLGCGDGTEISHLKSLGYPKATGVTFHDEEHDAAVTKGLVNADGHDLPMKEGSFDAAYSKEYLEHLIAPFIGVYEMARVLKVGGKFCHFISVNLDKQREPYHFSCFQEFVWIDLFHKAGLEVQSWRQVKIYGDKDHQIVLEGVKREQRDLKKAVEGYDLRGLCNTTRKMPLTLMDGPRPR